MKNFFKVIKDNLYLIIVIPISILIFLVVIRFLIYFNVIACNYRTLNDLKQIDTVEMISLLILFLLIFLIILYFSLAVHSKRYTNYYVYQSKLIEKAVRKLTIDELFVIIECFYNKNKILEKRTEIKVYQIEKIEKAINHTLQQVIENLKNKYILNYKVEYDNYIIELDDLAHKYLNKKIYKKEIVVVVELGKITIINGMVIKKKKVFRF